MKIQDAVYEGIDEYIVRAQQSFWLMFTDVDAFDMRVRAGLRFGGQDPNEDKKIQLTKNLGLFSFEIFQAMLCGGESFKPAFVLFLWDRLIEARVIIRAFVPIKGNPFVDHQIIQPILLQHLRDDTFVNLFAPPASLVSRYQNSVVAVDVLAHGNLSRGTGFIVREGSRCFVITCKHNVDPSQGVLVQSLTSASGSTIRTKDFSLSDRYDIAVAEVFGESLGPHLAFSDDVEIFDEIFTLGYPRIPCADSMLLGHRGELNGKAHLYMENCPVLIISNQVSPGNSGGPVLNRYGYCVGMTINWLEGEWGKQTMRFSAALPAALLREATVT